MKMRTIAYWKSGVISVVLVLTGIFGSELWYFVENFSFGGRSFFGVIFFAPLVFWPVAKFLQVSYQTVLDLIPSAGCVTLALVKIQCLRDHCCEGRILYMNENYIYVRFPSQIVELINFLALAVILFLMSCKSRYKNKIFPLFLCFYGITRFALNFFRAELTTYAIGLSAGHFWSVISLMTGLIWLLLLCKKQVKETETME